MRKKEVKLALCDSEQEYVQLFGEYLRRCKELPWEIHSFTSVDELLKEGAENFALIVIAESLYGEELRDVDKERLLLLSESGFVVDESIAFVDKYQAAEEVLREILGRYADIADKGFSKLTKNYETKFIGFFSPVRRTMQTTMALAMGQILAAGHPTLYLNFEPFAGIGALLPDMQVSDLSDLLYFLEVSPDKFQLRMRTILRRLDRLDFIPPVRNGQNLLTVTGEKWLSLLHSIGELGEYEYVVLDLSEAIQGLFDVLRMCSRIITLKREDNTAGSKLIQYEKLLESWEYEDVQGKTKHTGVPRIHNLPSAPEMLTRGELADYVRTILEEAEYGFE